MDTGDQNLYYGSKRHHFMGADIKITGVVSTPFRHFVTKMAWIDRGLRIEEGVTF